MTSTCEEKARLLREYSLAASDYNRAVLILNSRSGVMPKQEYQRLRSFVETTRETAEQARSALDKHTDEHGC
jgi:hypothetical protein